MGKGDTYLFSIQILPTIRVRVCVCVYVHVPDWRDLGDFSTICRLLLLRFR